MAVPGRNASEIRMVHQEDAGLNVEMAKMAFAKGIWSYVCKMDDALRRYSAVKQHTLNSTAVVSLPIQKVRTYCTFSFPEVKNFLEIIFLAPEISTDRLVKRPSNHHRMSKCWEFVFA